MADILTVEAIHNATANSTILSGMCQFPGDQSTHVLSIAILEGIADITTQFTISGPNLNADGSWNASVQPAIPNTMSFTVQVSCTHGNSTTTTSLPMSQEFLE